MSITEDRILKDVAQFVAARGPSGQEDEVREICQRRMSEFCDQVTIDPVGHVIGKIKGKKPEPGIKVLVHMDENSLFIKRIEASGKILVRPIGGIRYWRVGDGPVEVLTDDGQVIPGVLGRGPRHTVENAAVKAANAGTAPNWELAYVNTRLSKEEMEKRGVQPGSRVILARSRRSLFTFEDCVGGYFFDDRANFAVMLAAGEEVKRNGPPECDVYLIGTSMEENGGAAAYTVRTVPGLITIALEAIPAAPEYEIPLDDVPVIAVKDGLVLYTRSVWRSLTAAAERASTGYRCRTLDRIGSDASLCFKTGSTPQIGMLGFPTDNTHGFEVCLPAGMANCAKLLAAYLGAGGKAS
jgi:putative aminopeptidase FrvX